MPPRRPPGWGPGARRYRVGGSDGPVDTVYLGVFDRAAGDAVGWFDESLIRNQDYELNIRLRQAGGTIWFDPELRVGYRPRGSGTELAKQYYEYGFWKAEVLRRHPNSIRFRQVLASIGPVAIVGCSLAGLRRPMFMSLPAMYVCLVASATIRGRRPLIGVVLVTSQFAWAAGMLHRMCGALLLRRTDR